MRKCYLHIGPHKSASTYLQKQVHDNEGALDDLGLHVVETCRKAGRACHPDFVDRFHKKSARAQLYNELASELERVPSDKAIFISTEKFDRFYRKNGHFGALKSFFGGLGCELHVVGVIRNPVDWLNSSYSQSTVGFRNFQVWSDYIVAPANLERFDTWIVFSKWIEHFSYSIIPMAKSVRESRIDLDFMNAIGVDDTNARRLEFSQDVVNPAHNPKALELNRLLTLTAHDDKIDLFGLPGLRNEVRRGNRQICASHGWTSGKFYGYSKPQYDAALNHFRPGVERFSNVVFPGKDWQEYFGTQHKDRNIFELSTSNGAEKEEFLAVFGESRKMLKRLVRRHAAGRLMGKLGFARAR